MILSGASGTGKSTALTQLSVMIFAWGGRSEGISRVAMSPAASGGRTVEPVIEEDF
jgi:predicted ATPase